MIKIRLDIDAEEQLEGVIEHTMRNFAIIGNRKTYGYIGLYRNNFILADSYPMTTCQPPLFSMRIKKRSREFELGNWYTNPTLYTGDFKALVEKLVEKHKHLAFTPQPRDTKLYG
jgi:deoxyadenosine/deoxycytidine kinase